MYKLALAIVLASAALGQGTSDHILDRTFQLTNTPATGLQEILTTLHTVAQIRQITINDKVATLSVSGSPDQIALAEWLVPKLDVLPGSSLVSSARAQKYFFAGNNNDVVQLFELKSAPLITSFQEMLTSLRTVADIQMIYQISAPRILILRSDSSHAALAEFMIAQLDEPAGSRSNSSVQSFQMTVDGSDTVIIYGLAHVTAGRDLQEILTTLRVVLDIQKVYQASAPNLLAVRGSANQIHMAEWLISALDKQIVSGIGDEVRMPNGNDDVVHVFYLRTGADLNSLVSSVRRMGLQRTYTRTNLPALVVRGRADQIAMVEHLISASLTSQ